MASDAQPRTAAQVRADAERLSTIADALADAIEAALPGWIERLVIERVQEWRGDLGPELAAQAAAAGDAARDEVVPELRRLLEADIDDQAANPLELLRSATRHASRVLEGAGVPAVARDHFAVRSFPGDVYDLMPATWSDVDEGLHELGITWGAAKAYVHKARRRDEGLG